MVKLKTQDTGDFDLIPEGTIVPARLENVEAHSFDYQGEKIHKLKWFFTIIEEGEWFGKTVQGQTSTAFTSHPNCKAYNWAVAISGKQYQDGDELDTDDILGMPCQVIIKHRPDNQGRTWMEVRDVAPAARQSGQPTQVPADESPF